MKKIILLILMLMFSTEVQAFLAKNYNIEMLSTKADKIFMGEVTGIDDGPKGSKYPFIIVHFRVKESLKGNVGRDFSFNLVTLKGKQFEMMGLSRKNYPIGEKLVMFMGSPSPRTQLSAPVNLEVFRVETASSDPDQINKAVIFNKFLGQKLKTELFENLQRPGTQLLLKNMHKNTKPESGVTYQDFRNLIKASVQ